MTDHEVLIPVGDDEEVSGVLSVPENFKSGKAAAVIFAHGAANDMNNLLIQFVARGMGQSGYLTLRFNFLYKEKGRKSPDSQSKLIQTWQSVYRFLSTHPEFGPHSIVACGKSMGGRVASQMVADGLLDVSHLIFLGYPLHAPGKKDQLRDSHLYQIQTPMLFFAGTRDALCDLDRLNMVLDRLAAPWNLEVIQGGDHSFRVPKSNSISQEDTYAQILRTTEAWLGKQP
jgi:predicted alpha/beta-hydrolase family hydrolase